MSRSSDIVSQLQRRRAERKKPKVNSKLMKVRIAENEVDGIVTAAENKPPPITLQKTGGRNSLSLFFSIGLHISLALLLGFIYIKDRISTDDEGIEAALVPPENLDLRKRTSLPVRKRPTFEAEQQEIKAPIERDVVTNNNILTPREGDFILPSTEGTDFGSETLGLDPGPRINVPRTRKSPVETTTPVLTPKPDRPQGATFSPDLSNLPTETSNPILNVPDIDTSDLESSPPKVKKKVDPIYPQNAKRAEKEGTVKLQATIGTDGIPKNIVALTKPGFGFEDAAIDALKKWRFVPGKKKGKDAEMTVSIDIQFKLDD